MKSRSILFVLALAASVAVTGCTGENQAAPAPETDATMSGGPITKGGDDRTGQYDVVENWWKAAPNHDDVWGWGQVAGLAVDTADRIIVVTRGDWPANRREPRQPLHRRAVIAWVRRAARRAQIKNKGVHVLRHPFCSHLAMRGAPARAIQELAGHANITTTHRYMHLSPAAIEGAIRRLDQPQTGSGFGDILETADR